MSDQPTLSSKTLFQDLRSVFQTILYLRRFIFIKKKLNFSHKFYFYLNKNKNGVFKYTHPTGWLSLPEVNIGRCACMKFSDNI